MKHPSVPLIGSVPSFFRSAQALPWAVVLAGAGIALGCESDGGGSAGHGDSGVGGLIIVGTGGTTGSGGRTSSGGTSNGGAKSSGGTTSTGGSISTGGGGRGATGQQPIGALCVNDSNCSQTQGMAVCCATPGCPGPCECRLTAQCPKNGLFLECNGAADCAAFGGGKLCCKASSGSQTMQYCTKTNGCAGTVLP